MESRRHESLGCVHSREYRPSGEPSSVWSERERFPAQRNGLAVLSFVWRISLQVPLEPSSNPVPLRQCAARPSRADLIACVVNVPETYLAQHLAPNVAHRRSRRPTHRVERHIVAQRVALRAVRDWSCSQYSSLFAVPRPSTSVGRLRSTTSLRFPSFSFFHPTGGCYSI